MFGVKSLDKLIWIFWTILRPSDPAHLSKNLNHSISTRYKQGVVITGRTKRPMFIFKLEKYIMLGSGHHLATSAIYDQYMKPSQRFFS